MRFSLIICAAALAGPAAPALAFDPLTGDSARFLGVDGRQMRGWVDYAVSREGPDRYTTASFAELSYGLFEKLDLMVTVPWQGWSSQGISRSGLGDVLLEGKFYAGNKAGWTLAVKPGFSLPAGDEAKSLGAGKGGFWAYGIAGRAAGDWQFCLNAGYLNNRNTADEKVNIFKGSAAAAYAALPKVLLTAELAAETNADKNSSTPPLSSVFGMVWSPYSTLDLEAGIRLGLNNPADDMALLAGLALRI